MSERQSALRHPVEVTIAAAKAIQSEILGINIRSAERAALSALDAVADELRAEALVQFADAHRMPWAMFLRHDGSAVTVGDLLRECAAKLRGESDD